MKKKTEEKFLDQLDDLSYRLNQDKEWQREAFIAGYEQKKLLPPWAPRDPWFRVAMFGALVVANMTAVKLDMESDRTSALVTVGLVAVFGLHMVGKRLKAEKEYARAKKLMLNLKPGQRERIFEDGRINNLSDAYTLGWFCHRRQSEADIGLAVQIIRSNRLFEEYKPTDVILNQPLIQDKPEVPRGPRNYLQFG